MAFETRLKASSFVAAAAFGVAGTFSTTASTQNPAEPDPVTTADDPRRVGRKSHRADEGAIRAALVFDEVIRTALSKGGVTLADGEIRKPQFARLGASDEDARTVERNRALRGGIPGKHYERQSHWGQPCAPRGLVSRR
ncbi:MAG: hypothetical protein QM784_16250 [Polyangiaceae bacterium]